MASRALLCLAAFSSVATALTTQVLSSFIFHRHGDRVPLVSPELSVLTPYGAQQMFASGAQFRSRYLPSTAVGADESNIIRGISQDILDSTEVIILSTDQPYTIASAQAFLQGLYPPLYSTYNEAYIPGLSRLANGTNVVAPLGGYQYPMVQSASSYDLRSIWVDGAGSCPALTTVLMDYYNSSDFKSIEQSTLSFYQGLENQFLDVDFPTNEAGYFNSWYIWDFLQYQYLHNSSVQQGLSIEDYTKAEVLAADWTFAILGNASSTVSTIAGRSLATAIMSTFYGSINSQSTAGKITLYVGEHTPMYSLAALLGLTRPSSAEFYSVPPTASAMVFELVAMTDGVSTSYPNTSDMYVRFYYMNGTADSSGLTEYPIFGHGPSQAMMTYNEFESEMQDISLSSVFQWCNTCASGTLYCLGLDDNGENSGSSGGSSGNNHKSKISPAVGGVIGAVIALAIAGLLFAILAAVGFRVHKKGYKKAELGGYKGSQKLASDQDLTIPKGAATTTTTEVDEHGPRGHERVGSWELKNSDKAIEDDAIHIDPYAPQVKPHYHV